MPHSGGLEYILHHADAETIAVVFGRGDGGFVFTAVFDPRFELFVPGVGSDAIWEMMLVFYNSRKQEGEEGKNSPMIPTTNSFFSSSKPAIKE